MYIERRSSPALWKKGAGPVVPGPAVPKGCSYRQVVKLLF